MSGHSTEVAERIRSLVEGIKERDTRSIARAISIVENRQSQFESLYDELYPSVGRAWRIGVTGPPGAGKSTLVTKLVEIFAGGDQSVAVVAVDPSSPFTGGALLGDRIRMSSFAELDNVYVRSVATRGANGGLSVATTDVVDILDAAGFDVIVVETVGVGQAELDVAAACDTVLVTLVPESGDSIQAMKAGMMEIADVFCINKSDRPEADALKNALNSMLHLAPPEMRKPPIFLTVATTGDGLSDLVIGLGKHKDAVVDSGEWVEKRTARLQEKVESIKHEARLRKQYANDDDTPQARLKALDKLDRRPYQLAGADAPEL